MFVRTLNELVEIIDEKVVCVKSVILYCKLASMLNCSLVFVVWDTEHSKKSKTSSSPQFPYI